VERYNGALYRAILYDVRPNEFYRSEKLVQAVFAHFFPLDRLWGI